MANPLGDEVAEPFPIFLMAGRYMLYDVNVVSYIRRVYHMCGCLIGTLPQVPQQNVFLGLPLELMIEEAALLLEKGVAYIVDDMQAHKLGRTAMLEQAKQRYLTQRDEQLRLLADVNQQEAIARKAIALEKKGLANLLKHSSTPSEKHNNKGNVSAPFKDEANGIGQHGTAADEEVPRSQSAEIATSLFDTSQITPTNHSMEEVFVRFHETPTTSNSVYHQLPSTATTPTHLIPKPQHSRYPIYRHLHRHGYFLSPGIRFGAQYVAYPGDPLRFHSHFVVNGLGWDEELSMIDIVGGGRLGTGVKKAWMVGGKDPSWKVEERSGFDGVRVFSVEWGGF